MQRLRAEGVPFNESLPWTEDENETRFRTPDEVVDRAIALMAVAGKGEKATPELVSRFIEDFHVRPKLTPVERSFMENSAPAERDFAQFSWRYEALRVLLWSVGLVGELPRPEGLVDPAILGRIVLGGTEAGLRKQARLRPGSELLDFSDLLYCYHWAVREARLRGDDPPAGLHPGVVLEWDHASRWLIGYDDQEQWDDISCDT